MRGLLQIVVLTGFLFSCGDQAVNSGSSFDIQYYVDRSYTGIDTNSLVIKLKDAAGYKFSISGEGFDADVPKNSSLPVQEQTNLSYFDEGFYSLRITITRPDGIVYVEDYLTWDYSKEVPPRPDISFSEAATADDIVDFLMPGNLDPAIAELWIEGDLASSGGAWHKIGSDLKITKSVTLADGVKNFRVKYRNIYGNIGDSVDMSILKKSVGPQNCQAKLASTSSASSRIRLFLSVENDGEMSYQITGDVNPTPWETFEDEGEVVAILAGDPGVKQLVVSMKDVAGNACPDIPLTVTLDPSYEPYSVTIKDDLLWTDELNVTAVLKFDRLPSDVIEMYISGGISAGEKIESWIPFEEELEIRLSPVDGNRFVYAQYRDEDGNLSEKVYAAIFLKPFVYLNSFGSSYYVAVSNFVPIVDLSISGCSQTYNHVAYQENYICNLSASQVEVSYFLSDGSSVTRSASP
ncbi:MAG: hypothetical protein HYW48_00370 [Deltaproteobacteria bacterium]|nr:hypothetical protein [Deltaproteobacteria bacterium]